MHSRLRRVAGFVVVGVVLLSAPGPASAEQAGAGPAGPRQLLAGRIDTGYSHSCAIVDNGSVRCWGSNGFGRLGYPGLSMVGDNEDPASVGAVDLGPGRTATAISAGATSTCAVLDDASVRCWGQNDDGELGYADTTEDIGNDETPAAAGPVDLGGRAAVATTSGSDHSCALLQFGQISCWGSNALGQLGHGPEAAVGATPGTYQVALGVGRSATAVSAGSSHTCAVLDDGNVRCWGYNVAGQLGYADTSENIGDDEIPAAAGPVDLAGRRAIAIAAGAFHTCALLEFGQVSCWGSNSRGALGHGGEAAVGATPGPTRSPWASDARRPRSPPAGTTPAPCSTTARPAAGVKLGMARSATGTPRTSAMTRSRLLPVRSPEPER